MKKNKKQQQIPKKYIKALSNNFLWTRPTDPWYNMLQTLERRRKIICQMNIHLIESILRIIFYFLIRINQNNILFPYYKLYRVGSPIVRRLIGFLYKSSYLSSTKMLIIVSRKFWSVSSGLLLGSFYRGASFLQYHLFNIIFKNILPGDIYLLYPLFDFVYFLQTVFTFLNHSATMGTVLVYGSIFILFDLLGSSHWKMFLEKNNRHFSR